MLNTALKKLFAFSIILNSAVIYPRYPTAKGAHLTIVGLCNLIGIPPSRGSLVTAPIAWVCGWTEVSLSPLPVIALITVPCNVQVLKAAAFACVACPLPDSRKNVSDMLYIQLSRYFENFFTSHLYSRKFQILITGTFTFSTFYKIALLVNCNRKNVADMLYIQS